MAFTVKIAGVDKTSLIKAKTLITDLAADHRDSCRFTIMTQAGTYLPRAGMSVTVEDGGTVFAGLIDSAPQTKVSAEDGASTNITVAVSAKGLYAIPYRRSATESYASVDAGDIVSDLITSYLAAEGITAGTITAGAAFDAYDTYGKSIGAVLDELANASGYQWYIDNAKALHFVQDIVASAAAHDIDTSGAFTDFRDVLVDESLDQYRNRQIIRGGIQADGTSLNYVAEDAAEIAARATIEGGSGVYEHVHTDTNIIDATNAAAVAANLLKKYGRVQLEISFRSFATDWRPATKLKVNLAAFGISSDRYFLVERVSMQDIGGATLLVTVNGVSKNDSDFSTQMSDRYIDFFAKLLAGQKQNISYTNAVAAGKNKVYFQASQPTGGTYTPGDTWFDTDDDNRIYEWNGSAWVAVQFGENAIADLAITDAKIANATISNAKIANIDAGKVTTGYLAAARIQAGTLTFDKLASAAVTDITDTINIGGRNLVVQSTIVDGYYINDTGTLVANAGWSVTPSIPVLPGEQFIASGYTTLGKAPATIFMNSSWAFISGVAGSARATVTAPNRAAYMRFSVYGLDKPTIKLERGNKATDWTPAPEDKADTADLGDLAYEDLVESAKLGSTVIEGGLIKSTLLTADNVVTGKLQSVDGKAWFDLDTPEIVQTATIDGKDTRVEMSPDNPFKLTIDGQDHIYVTDASGMSGANILVTSRYDINQDGVVDWRDMKIMSDYILHRDIEPGTAWPAGYPLDRMDFNGSGSVNSIDATLLAWNSVTSDRIVNSGVVIGIANGKLYYSNDYGDTVEYFPDIRIRSTATSSGSSSTAWIQIAEIEFTARYQFASTKIEVIGPPSSAGAGYGATVYLSIIQQSALGNNPVGAVYVSDCIGLSTSSVKAVLTTVDAVSSIIELYVQAVHQYKHVTTRVLTEKSTANTTDHTLGSWTASLPAGTQLTTTLID